MKKLLTSNITQTAGLPVGPKTLNHLQEAYKEIVDELAKALIGDFTGVTIFRGCDVSKTGQDFTVTAGSIYYNGEIYPVDAGSFTAPVGQTAVWKIDPTFISSDPTPFTNGQAYNIHQINKMKLQAGASGSGVSDYDGVKYFGRHSELLNGNALIASVSRGFVTLSGSIGDGSSLYPNNSLVFTLPAKFIPGGSPLILNVPALAYTAGGGTQPYVPVILRIYLHNGQIEVSYIDSGTYNIFYFTVTYPLF